MTLFREEAQGNASSKSLLRPSQAGASVANGRKVLPSMGAIGQPTLIAAATALSSSTNAAGLRPDINKKRKKKKDEAGGATNGSLQFEAQRGPQRSPEARHLFNKMYHWQSEGTKGTSVEDMVLLPKISEAAITENLKKRLVSEDRIYTYIGPVLVSVNPFKQMPYFTEKEIQMYQGAAHYEVPPHIYALADNMYRNMIIDGDSQCVIISGESGAGKTVSAKYIMNYMTRVSGGGTRVQRVKDVILESNPLLEAFGNAKTVRNNNSSRFGKYIEIEFSRGGEPRGGRISNFLLEKSRVHFLNEGERNFHIFYQLCSTAREDLQSDLGIASPDYYSYLSQSGVFTADGTDDQREFEDTLKAMGVMGMNEETQIDVLRVVAAILHMGNISFVEEGNKARIFDHNYLEFPAFLLGISTEALNQKLTSRVFDSKWGSVSERVDVLLNEEQAQFARDAWAKGLYSRLFDYIVQTINTAMATEAEDARLGILDIYGFEIFTRNGFEQFCINYVNEKLQQIFIELTLKNEQEEYKEEGIAWRPIEFFNNKVVCDLIESKRPPGIFSVLDDTVATMSAVSEGADLDFRNKMTSQVGHSPHYQTFKDGFTIRHYAGRVDYRVEGFCEKNRDVLFVDIIEVMQKSTNAFIRSLFPEDVSSAVKGRPSTVAAKIREQANRLVTTLSSCVPHYIRCIKPNETKRPKDWDNARVKDQVEYLGLKENIKVKRAGFAYRRPFEKFLRRYAILVKGDVAQLLRDPKNGIHKIMTSVNMDASQYQLGITKCFIKDPESLYMLEEFRERKFDHYARVIQKAFKKYFSKQLYMRDKMEACDALLNRKQRRENSINRNFFGDYIGVDLKPSLSKLIPKREKVEFSETVRKYDRRFKTHKRDLILTKNAIYLVGLAKIKKGPQKGQVTEVIKRKIDLPKITQVSLSTLADNFVLLGAQDEFETLLEVNFKTEFLMLLNRRMKELLNRELPRNFSNNLEYKVKKTMLGRGGSRRVVFSQVESLSSSAGKKTLSAMSTTDASSALSSAGNTLAVKVLPQLPAGTLSSPRKITPEIRILVDQVGYSRRNNNNNNNNNNNKKIPHSRTDGSPGKRRGNAASQPKIRLPSQNQRWPPSGNQVTHIVPPPPNEPAPANQPVVPRKPPLIKPKPRMNQVRAIYSYDARDNDEITFDEGNILELVKEDDSGWWTCRLRGREGFCPGNYLEKI